MSAVLPQLPAQGLDGDFTTKFRVHSTPHLPDWCCCRWSSATVRQIRPSAFAAMWRSPKREYDGATRMAR